MSALGFGARFYLGLGAPAQRGGYPECTVRAARGYAPDLVRALLQLYRGEEHPEIGALERVNFRCGKITLAGSGGQFFLKEFPRLHRGHDVERALRLSRVDRAWRAAHLLPRIGVHTPAAVGTAQAPTGQGSVTEYLATRWLEGGMPFPDALAAGEREVRLREFAALMRRLHTCGVYTRDFVKNVLVVGSGERTYWLTDLDGVHPLRRVNRRRILFHMNQLAFYCPLSDAEAALVCETYLGTREGTWAQALLVALRSS